MNKNNGILISLEGIDGCGKTLLAKNLELELKKQNLPILLTKQPGGTQLGIGLRKILQENKDQTCPMAEYLLFAADRAQHIKNVIKPALNENKIIISDRMADSSVAYQGYGKDLDVEKIKYINSWAMQGIKPNLILYIKINIETAKKRIFARNEELTSFEKETEIFWRKVIDGYSEIFAKKKNVYILDGKMTPNQLTQIALDKILTLYNK